MKKLIIKWAIQQLVDLYHREPSYEILGQCGIEDMSLNEKTSEIMIIVMDKKHKEVQ